MNKKISIALPASVISDTPHLREKTSKIGLIGRTAAIYKVNEIIVYPDNSKVNQRRDMKLIATLLAYLETPQYLRKRLFKIEPQLKFAGILPPLRTPHHPLNKKIMKLKVGEYREGAVISGTEEGVLVDIGVDRPAVMREAKEPVGKRITVRIVKVAKQVEVKLAHRSEISAYWGYKVIVESRSLVELLKQGNHNLAIATSKSGSAFTKEAARIAHQWTEAKRILLVFGAPNRGIYEIAKDEGANLDTLVDFVINTIPNQGTETVRTEEALLASLAVFNIQFDC
jgi:predicted SPOUT superfamily RNA methylase MTH1